MYTTIARYNCSTFTCSIQREVTLSDIHVHVQQFLEKGFPNQEFNHGNKITPIQSLNYTCMVKGV